MHLDVSQVKSIACASIRLLFYPFCYCCCISPSSILETCLYRKGKRKGDSEHIDYNTMHIVWNVSSSLLMGIWFYSFTSHILNHFFFKFRFSIRWFCLVVVLWNRIRLVAQTNRITCLSSMHQKWSSHKILLSFQECWAYSYCLLLCIGEQW